MKISDENVNDWGLVSIITPSYNSAKFIGATIESIQAQTYQNWELIITDDCSTDNSCDVIQHYAQKDPRIKLLRLPKNSGSGIARNTSIEKANGRFIAFCDSDDRWYPNKLEKQLDFLIRNNYELTYSSYDVCDETNNLISYVICPKKVSHTSMLRDCGIGCLTGIYDTTNIGKVYFPNLRKRQDWGMWLQLMRKVKYGYGINERLALYRLRNNSLSSNKFKLLKYNHLVYKEIEGYPSFIAWGLLFLYFMPYYFYKKTKQRIYSHKRIK